MEAVKRIRRRVAPAVAAILAVACGAPAFVGETTTLSATSSTLQVTTSIPASTRLPLFDVEAFLGTKLDGSFGEQEDEVGVVVLGPVGSEAAIESLVNGNTLSELLGYSYVSSDHLRMAADRYAIGNGMEMLEGTWVGYGLIPRFTDSPTSEWVPVLEGLSGTIVERVDVVQDPLQLPKGWRHVAVLPFQSGSGHVVGAIDAGVVVVGPAATWFVGYDGTSTSIESPPVHIPDWCCGSVAGLEAGSSFVLVEEGSATTWIFDGDTLAWRQAHPRPETLYTLGSALLGRELFVVNAAPRSEDAVSAVSVLDLDTGSWRQLEPVPSPISVGGVTTDGSRLIVAGTRQDGNNLISGSRNPIAYEYTSDEEWRRLEDIPIDGQASGIAWVDGAGLLAWNYELRSAFLDGAGTWRTLDNVPMDQAECHPQSFVTPDGVVGMCGGLAWFDKGSQTWTSISSSYETLHLVTDAAVLGVVEVGREESWMIAYDLPPNPG